MPALYQAANDASLTAQRMFFRALRVRLGGLLVAAVGGAFAWQYKGLHLGGWLALLAFLSAVGAELYGAVARPDRVWYEGRAAAESAKTLAWRYMVKGESFDSEDELTDTRFVGELTEILQDLKDIELGATSESRQISSAMRDVRASDFGTRKRIYLRDRIEDQRGWYARKAAWNARRARRWLLVGIVAEVLGIIGAAMMALGHAEVDLLGVFAAIAATAAAWVQAKQHQTLSTAYGVTAQELSSVASELESLQDEATWARFVGEAEEAISREHTLWRASRGIRVNTRRRGSS